MAGGHFFFNQTRTCSPINYTPEVCILSKFALNCPASNFILVNLFAPHPCGELVGYARLVSTRKYSATLARVVFHGDDVLYSGNFKNLWDILNPNNDQILGFQLGLCRLPEVHAMNQEERLAAAEEIEQQEKRKLESI